MLMAIPIPYCNPQLCTVCNNMIISLDISKVMSFTLFGSCTRSPVLVYLAAVDGPVVSPCASQTSQQFGVKAEVEEDGEAPVAHGAK